MERIAEFNKKSKQKKEAIINELMKEINYKRADLEGMSLYNLETLLGGIILFDPEKRERWRDERKQG